MRSRAAMIVLVAVGALLPVLPGMPIFWITLLNNIGLGRPGGDRPGRF